MKRNLLILSALLIPAVIAGCVASGTIVIVQEIEGFASSNNLVNVRHVSLSDNSDFEDNKDKIKSVDAISFAGSIINYGNAENRGEVYFSNVGTYTTAAEVRSNATRIFVSPAVPAGDSIFIDWGEGASHFENLSVLVTELKDEDADFYLYGVAEETPFNMYFNVALVVTMTAGL